jgi:hypothetical protein
MPFWGSKKGNECLSTQGANGMLQVGTRVQTINDEGRNADNKWYVGTVVTCWDKGYVKIDYDDPDECKKPHEPCVR